MRLVPELALSILRQNWLNRPVGPVCALAPGLDLCWRRTPVGARGEPFSEWVESSLPETRLTHCATARFVGQSEIPRPLANDSLHLSCGSADELQRIGSLRQEPTCAPTTLAHYRCAVSRALALADGVRTAVVLLRDCDHGISVGLYRLRAQCLAGRRHFDVYAVACSSRS